MWGLDTIRAINDDAAAKSRQRSRRPTTVASEDEIVAWPPFPFPHLGYACSDIDDERERLETLFVDSSGLGAEDEAALTLKAFKGRLVDLFREHGPLLCAIEEQGQFQLYVAVWRGDGS